MKRLSPGDPFPVIRGVHFSPPYPGGEFAYGEMQTIKHIGNKFAAIDADSAIIEWAAPARPAYCAGTVGPLLFIPFNGNRCPRRRRRRGVFFALFEFRTASIFHVNKEVRSESPTGDVIIPKAAAKEVHKQMTE